MFKTLALSAVTALTLSAGGVMAAGGGDQHIEDFDFSFEGPFGVYSFEPIAARSSGLHRSVCRLSRPEIRAFAYAFG